MNFNISNILYLIIACLAVYSMLKSIQNWIEFKKSKEDFILNNGDVYETFQDYFFRMFVYLLMLVTMIIGLIYMVINNEWIVVIGYVGLCIFIVSFLMDAYTQKQVFFDSKGFLYRNTYYRYRTGVKSNLVNGIISSYELTIKNETIRVSKKIGKVIIEHADKNHKQIKLKK